MNLHGLSDSVAGVIESPAQCRQCSATTRLGNGLCLSCTLREGLEGDREASRESFEAILAEDEVRDTHWRVGNYEILEEIGRGGMGVIYRARQRHSRRIVALKRMVSYHADSRETLERFRREAEAAASLDHPNILPIYEVGQAEDGLPFFSMKYAAGGACKKLGLLCATNCANAYGLWPRWGVLCNTRMSTAFCIAILSQETSCLTVRANHS